MSGTKTRNNELSAGDQGEFEFALGTLRGLQRRKFSIAMQKSDVLLQAVEFWEEKLIGLVPHETREPAAVTWENIANHIAKPERSPKRTDVNFANFWQWAMPSIAAFGLMFVLVGYYPTAQVATLNTDYVAVLTSADGEPYLTALTAENGKQMLLKWEVPTVALEGDIQLWAKSKRDGEIRPISVFSNTSTKTLVLTTSTWRLITDAQSLILTKEEPGGSAIDEPSTEVLARGVCVRFSEQKNTI